MAYEFLVKLWYMQQIFIHAYFEEKQGVELKAACEVEARGQFKVQTRN